VGDIVGQPQNAPTVMVARGSTHHYYFSLIHEAERIELFKI